MGVLGSRVRTRRTVWCLVWAAIALLTLVACGPRNVVTGTIIKVDRELGMVLIAQPGVEGVLPAGETGFHVASEKLLGTLGPGQVGRVVFAEAESGFSLRDFGLERYTTRAEGWINLAGERVQTEAAPPLDLINEKGQSFGLKDLAGRAVLLGFIYTQCPGPCPIQTSDHMAVRRGLDDDTAQQTWFVMVTIDPARDNPAALLEYRDAHGVEYENWTFLTGPVDVVEASNRDWGVAATFNEDGMIDHTPIVYLLDGSGRIVKRYVGTGQDPDTIIRDMTSVVQAPRTTPAG
jgi:protein SCO1/2